MVVPEGALGEGLAEEVEGSVEEEEEATTVAVGGVAIVVAWVVEAGTETGLQDMVRTWLLMGWFEVAAAGSVARVKVRRHGWEGGGQGQPADTWCD